MRVLHLTDRLTDRGGAHRHLLSITRALAERGHDVHIAAGAVEVAVWPQCGFERDALTDRLERLYQS